MKACLASAAGLLLSLAAAGASAQSTAGCPQLPAGTGLHWERSGTAALVICKALDAAGQQAFGVMLAAKEPDKPAGAREEKTEFDGRKARWYHTRIANRPDARSRMAVIELGDERWAQVWIDAPSEAALQAAMATVGTLRFDPASMADANTRR